LFFCDPSSRGGRRSAPRPRANVCNPAEIIVLDHSDPKGIKDISSGLSEATPRDKIQQDQATLKGLQRGFNHHSDQTTPTNPTPKKTAFYNLCHSHDKDCKPSVL